MILTLLFCFLTVGACCYEAGRLTGHLQAKWAQQSADQYEAAMAPSRQRHPSAR